MGTQLDMGKILLEVRHHRVLKCVKMHLSHVVLYWHHLCHINHTRVVSIMLVLPCMQTIGRFNLNWKSDLCKATQRVSIEPYTTINFQLIYKINLQYYFLYSFLQSFLYEVILSHTEQCVVTHSSIYFIDQSFSSIYLQFSKSYWYALYFLFIITSLQHEP